MCGRFTEKDTIREFADHIYGFKSKNLSERHNIKPTQNVSIVTSSDGADVETVEVRWWLQKEGA